MALPLAAQCAQWTHPEGAVGVDGELFTTVRGDPDGAGPRPEGVVCGGAFQYAGSIGASRVALLDPGTGTFTALGSGGDATVRCTVVLPSGDLIVGGEFTTAGGQPAAAIARWNGTSWSALGSGLGGVVHSLLVLPNGDLIATGAFASAGGQPAGNVARWNGAVWSAVGGGTNGTVFARAVMPNGDLIAAGIVSTLHGIAVNNIARWNGSTWSALGSGIAIVGANLAPVLALAVAPSGRLFVGGDFRFVDGAPSNVLANYESTCPATVAVGAAGCSGVHGTSTFVGVDRPWLGASFHGRGTGLPASALVVVGAGLTPLQLPVGLLLSPSPPACTFALAYDAMDIQLTTSGTVDTVLGLPNEPAFVGTVIHQQLLTIGIDAALQFGESTVSNSLVLTCGVF